nr:E3 ubiquitin-protein ligase TRIM39-like [Ciona intestinalis]|eukprot:XP_026692648.1 E3 ubiquitin-protein ligase TRIM39-like [Ciona intestinalis]
MEGSEPGSLNKCPGCTERRNGDCTAVNTTIDKQAGTESDTSKPHSWKDDLNCLCTCGKRKSVSKVGNEQSGNTARDKQTSRFEKNKENNSNSKSLDTESKFNTKSSGLEKSYTLPTKLNDVSGLRRNQRNFFGGRMEVLSEDKGDEVQVPPLALDGVKKNGNLRNWKTKDNREPKQKNPPNFMKSVCPNHDEQKETLEAVLYCDACSQSVCYKCAFERHKDHTVTPIPAAAERVRVNLAERKRRIENVISQMRTKRKTAETSSEELKQRIHVQFEQLIQRVKKKEDDVMGELAKIKQRRINIIYGVQNQQETAWGQIDAVLKTQEDVKMLQEYNGLSLVDYKDPTTSPRENGGKFLLHGETPRPTLDLNSVQDEIEKVRLSGVNIDTTGDTTAVVIKEGITPRGNRNRFSFKLDAFTAHSALRVSSNYTSVEYVGSERNGVTVRNSQPFNSVSNSNPYQSKPPGYHSLPNGVAAGRLKRAQFATVIGDSSITQGKQYWEVSVNRSMEYRLGVAYKHMQGTKTLADEHNSWALCLTYPDRFSATHKHHKEYIFVPTHVAARATKVVRIGIFLDYERGVLSFYNASTASEKRHIYTFRTFFNRPVWPLLSLRQGKLQILTGLAVPRNLVWKTR